MDGGESVVKIGWVFFLTGVGLGIGTALLLLPAMREETRGYPRARAGKGSKILRRAKESTREYAQLVGSESALDPYI